MFKFTKEYKEIFELLRNENLLNKTATFSCYADNIFTIHLEENEKLYEFNISCKNSIFSKMYLHYLLDLDYITYFKLSVYSKENRITERINTIMWTIYNNTNLN